MEIMISYHLHQLPKIIKAMTDNKRLPPSKDMNIAYVIYSLSLTKLNKPHFNKLFFNYGWEEKIGIEH